MLHLRVLLTAGIGWEEFTAILDGDGGRVAFTGLFLLTNPSGSSEVLCGGVAFSGFWDQATT